MISRVASALAVATFCMGCALSACAQRAAGMCGAPPVISPNARSNIFNNQQEQWLGDAMADAFESNSRPARDPSLSAHLQEIVDRLAATLPDTKINFRVQLVDSAEINGSSLAGGRIYISRKLAAAANNNDELAAVLGHEMGHIASHQFAFETTADLKRLLGVTSVGDRADVYAKFQALMDAAFKDKHPTNGDSDDKQDEADRIGVYVTAAAGYRPQAIAEFWDRSFFVGGKTGNGLTDFFGITKPNQKRLRGIVKLAAALPPGCGGQAPQQTLEFAEWHRRIVANQEATTKVVTPVTREVVLNPPVRMDLAQLRYSRDGKMILAQDEASVFVLARDPLAVAFRVDATKAMPAQFSPDSKRIVFNTPGLHTEEWSIAEQKRLSVQEVVTRDQCYQTRISPDGRTLICVTFDLEHYKVGLSLLDVGTGSVVWQKKEFFEPTYMTAVMLLYSHGDDFERQYLPISFSADGNVVVLGPGTSKVAIDLRTRTQMKLGGALQADVDGDYAFMGNDKVAGVNRFDNKKSGIYSFPDGKQLQKMPLPFYAMESISGPDPVVLAYGVEDYGIAAANLETQRMTGLKTQALDIWNGTLVGESNDGAVLQMKIGNTDMKQVEQIKLPLSPLGEPASARISPDGKYLALSTRYHGGIWDLETGKQIGSMRGFVGAQWAPNDTLYVDVPKWQKADRHIAQVTLAGSRKLTEMTYKVDNNIHMRYGWLIEWKDSGKKASDLIMHNPANDSVLWTLTFPNGRATYTASFGDRDLIMNYQLGATGIKDRVKASPALSSELAALKNKDLGRLIEIIDARNGKTVAEMVMELPLNFEGTDGLNRAGDLLFVNGSDNRTMAYSLTTGKQVRQMFGYVSAVDPETSRVCTVNRRDEATVYDAAGKELAHLQLGTPMRYTAFGGKSSSLMVLTADQKVRTLDIGEPALAVAEAR